MDAGTKPIEYYRDKNGIIHPIFDISDITGDVISVNQTNKTIAINAGASGYSGYVGVTINNGNNADRYGWHIRCGADDGSGTTNYIRCSDGDNDAVGFIRNNSGTFELYDPSDETIKQKVKDSEVDGLNAVMLLRVRDYEYIKRPGITKTGFVAQDIESVVPDAVSADESGLKSIAKGVLIPYLVKAIQQLKNEIEELKAGK